MKDEVIKFLVQMVTERYGIDGSAGILRILFQGLTSRNTCLPLPPLFVELSMAQLALYNILEIFIFSLEG